MTTVDMREPSATNNDLGLDGIGFFQPVPTCVRVFGLPKGQPRARAFARNGIVRMYDPATAEGWKAAIADAMRKHIPSVPYECPMRLDIRFIMPRPKAHFRTGKHSNELRPDAPAWYSSAPDRDNLDKATLDALTQMGFWKDDALACAGYITKRYCESGQRPGAWLRFCHIVYEPTAQMK